MNFEEIKDYWENRASEDSSAQSTTQDFYLREIEFNVLAQNIEKYSPNNVADIGCGDGRTTVRLARKCPDISFKGFDYSTSMIKNTKAVLDSSDIINTLFEVYDVLEGMSGLFDLIYTTRCLINLPSWELQKIAISNIHNALIGDGVYLMIENFIEGQSNFNEVRKKFGLSEIPIREHNHFFERERLLGYIDDLFDLQSEVNISSTYYLASRVIYSKICDEAGIIPDYFDDHHRFAVGLPFCGEYGPVRLLILKKK
ncbi:MAG: class I SAM-dependent methyltransferase [Proteobacteria bacterium]|nr:class I SAM-dependent methyltransferase [Pseudomonadota bacterium]MBU1714522.1 class I SAM-dependent methyltransferase [Pseudomonadota bacterium]